MTRHRRRKYHTTSSSDKAGCLLSIFGIIGSFIALLFLSDNSNSKTIGWGIIGFFAAFCMFISAGVTSGWSIFFALLIAVCISCAISGMFKTSSSTYTKPIQKKLLEDQSQDDIVPEVSPSPELNKAKNKPKLFGGKKKQNEQHAPMHKSEKSKLLKYFLISTAFLVIFFGVLAVLNDITDSRTQLQATSVNESFAVEESSGGTYMGEIVDSVYSGQGQFQYLSKATYSGKYADSLRSGKGTYTWANGDSYTGTWENDDMKCGKYIFADGRYYEGSFAGNQYDDGDYYLDKACATNGFSEFHATIEDGKITRLSFKTIAGLAYDGAISGNADIVYISGNTYSGSVDNGIRSGEGTFAWVSNGTTTAYYQGEWMDDIMDGQGTYHYTDNEYPYIIGTFKQGKPDGNLTYYKEAGNTFDTVWSNGAVISIVES